MKKNLLILAFLVASMFVQAQHAPKSLLKFNPLSLLVKTSNISYEMATTANQSFQIGGFYSQINLGDLQFRGYGITPEYRFYIGGKKTALNGGYIAPFARYQNFSVEDETTTNKAQFSTFGGGVMIGWQKYWESGFVLDLFAGPSMNAARFSAGNKDDFEIKGGITGFGIRSGISIGFTF